MQPMLIIQLLQLLIESCTAEIVVDDFETGENACEKFFKCEGWEMGREEIVEGDCGSGVGGVHADADDEVVGCAGVGGVDEDTAEFDEGFFVGFGGVAGVLCRVSKTTSNLIAHGDEG